MRAPVLLHIIDYTAAVGHNVRDAVIIGTEKGCRTVAINKLSIIDVVTVEVAGCADTGSWT